MWKKLSSRIIHKNPWYNLREDDVLRPDGKEGKYYYVDGVSSIAVIAEDKDGEIYLVGQTRYPIGIEYSWEIITGGLKSGADFLEAAKRELREEAGLLAEEWIDLGYFNSSNGYSSDKTNIYLAKRLKVVETEHDPSEDITVKKESLDDIIKMIEQNKITCGMTIASIYKYLIYKNKL